jgi:hypothetical protein
LPDPPSHMSPMRIYTKKQEPKQIKVKLPDRTNFQMAAFGNGNNKKYLVHIIAVLRAIEQKGTEQDVKKAFEVFVEVRREIQPLLEFPDNKTDSKKEEHKNKLLSTRKSLRPSAILQLQRPRRHTSCSLALLLVRRKHNWTRLCMRCTPGVRESA